MKYFTFKMVLILILFLITTATAFAEEGGISGGGGGVVNGPGVNPIKIEFSLKDSRPLLIQLLNYLEYEFYAKVMDDKVIYNAEAKLFESKPDVFEVVTNLKISLQKEKPCYDRDGRIVDGSIYSHIPNAICISSFTLKDKLNDFNYDYETLALVVHEISHLMGANEEEAIALQLRALKVLANRNKDKAQSNLREIKENSKLHIAALKEFKSIGINAKWIDFAQLFSLSRFPLSLNLFMQDGFHILRAKDYFAFNGSFIARQLAFDNFTCAREKFFKTEREKKCDEIYNLGFGSEDIVLAEVFLKRIDPTFYKSIDTSLKPVYVRKIKNNKDFRAEVNEVIEQVENLFLELETLGQTKFEIIED